MNYPSARGLEPNSLLVPALIALILGMVASICALLIQVFLVLSDRRALSTGEFSRNVEDLHVSGCSLCMHRNCMDAGVQLSRNQAEM